MTYFHSGGIRVIAYVCVGALSTYQCFPSEGERSDSHGELDNFEILGTFSPPMGKYDVLWCTKSQHLILILFVIYFNEKFQLKCLISPPLCLGAQSNS